MKKLSVLLVALAAALALASPAGAITRGGTLDGQAHPYVGVMVAKGADGAPLWRCSGTLVSPTVYVTAGHCTETPAVTAEVWFETTLEPDRAAFGWPDQGATSVTGTTYTHPLYETDAFYRYDLGVVVLDIPVVLDRYASLPEVGVVDTLAPGRGTTVTAVGYGLQASSANPVKPEKTVSAITRYRANLFVVNSKGVGGVNRLPDGNSLFLSGDAKNGGTCFGDSGGPSLLGDTLVAVTSFGSNENCGGVGGVFRIDRQLELDWISSFL